VRSIYQHKLADLLKPAGLESELNAQMQIDPAFRARWTIVSKWSEQTRYSIWTYGDASAMIDAVAGRQDAKGVFQWLSERW
jgi:hypothetical protein